ncbi:MAG: transglutaminase-like cysteine peptidase [Pseudolabrys sp.]|nr:transglutaminase-like cysteine peptidase [Pseudolabrys sp.]
MLAVSQMCAAARVVALLGLAGLCGGAAVAQSAPPMQLAALTPAIDALQPAPSDTGPFGLTAAHSGTLAAKWRGLHPAIQIESRILEFCRTDAKLCTPAAAQFLAIVEAGRSRSGRARIGEINRAINLAIRPENDLVRFQLRDVWATPLTTFTAGAGDCEDYAIAKYVALREAGMPPEDLRIVIVRHRALGQDHAVAAARLDGEWLLLDNRHMRLSADNQASDMTPLVTLDHHDIQPAVEAAKVAEAT